MLRTLLRGLAHCPPVTPSCQKLGSRRCIWQLKTPVTRLASTAPSAVGFDDYEEGRKNFSLEVPEYFNFVTDVIDKWAEVQEREELEEGVDESGKVNPKHLAMWWTSELRPKIQLKWTFKQISEITKRTSYILTGPTGLVKGDRVVVMATLVPQFWTVQLACIKMGLIFVPCSYTTPEAIQRCLQAIKPKLIVCEESTITAVDQVIAECPSVKLKLFLPKDRYSYRPLGWYNYADMYFTSPGKVEESVLTRSDDVMSIYFTSGTVSQPKLVPHTYASYGLAHHITGKYFLDLVRSDIHWNFVEDSGWAKVAWSSVFGPWSQGAGIFVRQFKNSEPEKILEVLETYPITTLCSTPSEYRMLIQENLASCNFHSLRHCVSAGELLNPDVIEKWEAGTGIVIKDGYGQSETTVMCANFNCLPVKQGAMGKPVPGYDIDIIDDDDQVLPVGQVGNIAVRTNPNRPAGLFKGYEDDIKETLKVFSKDYYKTGDQGYMDQDGYLWFVSREADIIHTEGVEVSPFDIESELLEHPAVAECAAVSSPDEVHLTGTVIKAFVILADNYLGVDEDELIDMLRQHAHANLQPTHQPKKYAFTDYIPKTATGKVKRSVMRGQEWNGTTGHPENKRVATTA